MSKYEITKEQKAQGYRIYFNGFLEPRIKDKDNNIFSLVSCTLKQAIKNLETLENCKDCADCVNCVDCYRCEN